MAVKKVWEGVKDPEEIRDFGLDWLPDLSEGLTAGLTITSSVWSVIAGTVVILEQSHLPTSTVFRAADGTLGETCELLNHIVLSDGQELEMTGYMKIRKR